jgi:hypothetical protein
MQLPRQPRLPSSPAGAPPEGVPICEVVDGPTLGTLRVWSEAEWAALPEADRPGTHAHRPGLGWVGAVPVVSLN